MRSSKVIHIVGCHAEGEVGYVKQRVSALMGLIVLSSTPVAESKFLSLSRLIPGPC
jgi:proline racemase